MTQMQLTTREAVEIAIESMRTLLDFGYSCEKDEADMRAAIRLLCDLYGFKLEQFFDASYER